MGLCSGGDQAYEYQPSLGDIADLRRLVQALTERVAKLEQELARLKSDYFTYRIRRGSK